MRLAYTKEVHFFDHNHQLGTRWYRAHFPLRELARPRSCSLEATPYYLCHPLVPERVSRLLPSVKIVVVLRNPTDRAYSQYHMVREEYGYEPLDFDAALDAEADRLCGEEERLSADRLYFSFNHLFYSYKTRGLYGEQIERWLRWFSKDQVLVISSEELFQDPGTVLATILSFLGLEGNREHEFPKLNARSYPPMSSSTRARLNEFFRPHNQRLFDLLGRSFDWET